MAHKTGAGSSRNGRDSQPKYRGVKVYGGERVKAGGIILRQVGTHFKCGANVKLARDFSIFALKEGTVKFDHLKRVHVVPSSS